ncbi:hypothetical protein [Vibrio rotiferianus]|uniref:hypothetical protein n=1 Tax=Vibrio rotiferianus TaxID=190895 RepID=UPI0012E00AA7|nr:hypothetical protein [Vibrio rotiferianus]
MAFLVWVKFSVYGAQIECCGRVAHPLIGRYISLGRGTSMVIGDLSLGKIIERKIDFLLHNEIAPWDGDNYDLGEKDALERMLEDSGKLTESEFEEKYLKELVKLSNWFDGKDDDDEYYESYNNTIVSILELINPLHKYAPSDG